MSNELSMVDDAYWLSYARKMVDGAAQRRNDAADRLQTFAKWTLTIYLASAGLGFALSSKSLPLASTLYIAAGGASLVSVCWIAECARMPLTLSFLEDAPESIRDAYIVNIKSTSRWLLAAYVACTAAVLLAVVGLITASLPLPGPPSIDARNSDSDGGLVFVGGSLDAVGKITVTLEPIAGTTVQPIQVATQGNGQFFASVRQVPESPPPKRVIVRWTDKASREFEMRTSIRQ